MCNNLTNDKQLVDYRKNSLNTLKIIAAIQVVYGHAYVHMSYAFPKALSQILGIFMGVPIFFMLSGFLIWNSIGKSSDFKHYASKRFWRIYPELWLGVAIEIIVLLILFKEKINYLMLAIFGATQATFLQFWNPSFLTDYGCGVVNGALWTICVTIQFYVIVWLLYKMLHGKSYVYWISALALSVVFKILTPFIKQTVPEIIYDFYKVSIVPYLWLFVLGCALCEFRDKAIPFLKKFWWLLLGLSFIVAMLKIDIDAQNYGLILYSLRVPAFIGMAYAFPKINIKTDISYGIYIYHMIVINAMIELGYTGKLYYVIMVFILTVLLACGSTAFSKLINKKNQIKKT